ncbi:LPS assembly lipoprotein LptE [Lewinella sp. W8]|uniref:LPS assembly lipoprotein LptE n=1 Tax=Lewinella sp. W8 TaxID=2528208 RepID=UPI0020A68CCF|nr:LPS assembly lipoprotein LptE [Lewinella sp. W8]
MINMGIYRFSTLLLLLFAVTSCYSFRGISIPEGVEKAYIPNFQDNAIGAPPTLYLEMTESLRDKVRDEARLIITEDSPDIEITGKLVDFRVSAEAARPGNETAAFSALNRLTIVIAIEYKDLRNPDNEGWRQNFSNFFDFPGSQTLASVQDEAIADIIEQLNEQIFNKAFAEDW